MRNVDPPLDEDLKAIDSILCMKLKANQVRSYLSGDWPSKGPPLTKAFSSLSFQLNAHIENITAIATRIPTATVAHHMYSNLFREVLNLMDVAGSSNSDQLKMIAAIHRQTSPEFSYDAMAATFLMMLAGPQQKNGTCEELSRPGEICLSRSFGVLYEP